MRFRTTLALVLSVACVCALPAAAGAAEPFAAGCPTEAPEEGAVGSFNHNPASKKTTVPAGAVAVRVCRYWGFDNAAGGQTPKSQARAGSLRDEGTGDDRGLVESLTLEFADLGYVNKGTYSCPFDEGARLYAIFSYPAARPVVVEVGLSGCESVGNGRARARFLDGSLRRRLERLAEGHTALGKTPPGVKEKSAVALPPPHLSYAKARHSAASTLEGFCQETKLCASHSIRGCEREKANRFRCPYEATLKSGEVCRGGINVKLVPGGFLFVSPGVQSEDEGECFYLFAPPGFKEEEEELEREESREAKPGQPPKA